MVRTKISEVEPSTKVKGSKYDSSKSYNTLREIMRKDSSDESKLVCFSNYKTELFRHKKADVFSRFLANHIKGAATIFNIAGNFHRRKYAKMILRRDYEALESDWSKIRMDMECAMYKSINGKEQTPQK